MNKMEVLAVLISNVGQVFILSGQIANLSYNYQL